MVQWQFVQKAHIKKCEVKLEKLNWEIYLSGKMVYLGHVADLQQVTYIIRWKRSQKGISQLLLVLTPTPQNNFGWTLPSLPFPSFLLFISPLQLSIVHPYFSQEYHQKIVEILGHHIILVKINKCNRFNINFSYNKIRNFLNLKLQT